MSASINVYRCVKSDCDCRGYDVEFDFGAGDVVVFNMSLATLRELGEQLVTVARAVEKTLQ